MPEPGSARALNLLADLRVTVVGTGGEAAAHLHGGSDGLVLDVNHPAVLLGLAPGRSRGREFSLQAVQQLIPATPVHVRSQGRNLARLRLTPTGKVRVRPTPVGLLSAARAVLSSSPARLLAVSAGPVLVVLLTAGLVRRRIREPSR